MPDAEKVAAARQLLPATGAGIYLNAGAVGPLSAETAGAMAEVAERELAVGRAGRAAFPELLERLGEARASVAAILATDLERLALTHSTTEGMNAAIGAIAWDPGDIVVTTSHEHPAALGPLAVLRQRLGVEVRVVVIDDDHRDDELARALLDASAGARAIVISHVLWTTGRLMPVARIAEGRGPGRPWLVVDGAQAAGAILVRPHELGADAYALSGQKWLLGPEGTGALWLGDRALAELVPASAGFFSFAELDGPTGPRLHAHAQRFELGGWHPPSVVGLARACGWLSMFVGLPWAVERATSLARSVADELAAMPGVQLVTPRDAMATLVSFRVAGWPASAVVEELAVRAFAMVRDFPTLDLVRLSVGWWNTEEELERVLRVIALLAGHSPETLPRRRLAVLGSDGLPID